MVEAHSERSDQMQAGTAFLDLDRQKDMMQLCLAEFFIGKGSPAFAIPTFCDCYQPAIASFFVHQKPMRC